MPDDPTQRGTYPDLLDELASKIAAVLVARGIDVPLAKDAGQECAEFVRRDWGGQKIYIPMGKSHEVSQRDQEIAARWNGRNTRELCVEFGVSETTVRRATPKRGRQ